MKTILREKSFGEMKEITEHISCKHRGRERDTGPNEYHKDNKENRIKTEYRASVSHTNIIHHRI